MKRRIALYAAVLVIGAFALQWLEYRYLARTHSVSFFIALLATGFVALGIWVGTRLVRRQTPAEFKMNDAAIRSLGISPRELDVLRELASGRTNKEIARDLGISPNTVKTHVARLFQKLGASRRTEAINISRELKLIP